MLHFGCRVKPEYHQRAVQLVKDIHPAFVVPGVGVHWKMKEDLSGPYPVSTHMVGLIFGP